MVLRSFLFALLIGVFLVQPPASGEAGWIDDLNDAAAWSSNNSRAPAKFSVEKGILTLIDPPGGEVTWGTSIYRTLPEIDLDKYPYLAVNVTGLTGSFSIALVRSNPSRKVGGLCATSKPGVVVVNVPEQLGWRGKTSLQMGLYTFGTESRVSVDWVKFTGKLSREEQAAYNRWKRMRPKRPKPFHGLEEPASRRGWCHAPYFQVEMGARPGSEKPWVEEFDDVHAWRANNPRTPPEFTASGGILTLRDPPGGEVTWGTSIYTALPGINLSKNPYLVVKVAGLSAGFAVTLINNITREKIGGLCATEKPGLFAVNIPKQLGWSGVVPLSVGLYTQGTESWVKVDYVKLTGELSPAEKVAYQSGKKNAATARRPFSPPDSRTIYDCCFEPNVSYLSERLIYRDSVTGNIVWRMTNSPDVDKVIYYDISHWNADGTLLRWASARGASKQWLMNADGTGLHAWMAVSRRNAYNSHWSVRDPNAFFYSASEDGRTVIYRYDIRTGEEVEVASHDEPGFSMAPPHPDEKYFLISKRSKKDNTSIIYLLGPNGFERKFDFGRFVHRLRFTKGPGHDIFYNFDDPRTQWAIGADGSNNVQLTGSAGHPDWTWDGKWLTAYEAGRIVAVRRDGQEKYTLAALYAGGHGGPAMDGRSFISDVSRAGPYGNSILFIDMPTRVVHRVCVAWSSYYGHSNTGWHPDHHSTHPHPNSSPDATKTAFSTDFMSKYVNFYVCVNHLPDAPRDLHVERKDGGAVLCWRPGERHRETAGYYVYRSESSGGSYRQVNEELVRQTRLPIGRAEDFYVVTAVEPSGLESLPSEEVCAAPAWRGRVRRIVEAESCELSGGLRPYLEASTAVGMYYVGCSLEGDGGEMTLRVNVPRGGRYMLFARMRGTGRLDAGGDASLAASGKEWSWSKMEKPLDLAAGEQRIILKVAEGEPEIDQFILTDEDGFTPDGPAVLDGRPPAPPAGLTAKALDPFNVRLRWEKSSSVDVSYYNVYCGGAPDYEPCQARLIGSPAEIQFLDWGLAPGTVYHYKVVAVDRAGNESKPAVVRVETPAAKSATVTVSAAGGKVTAPARVVEAGLPDGGKAVEFPKADRAGMLEIRFELPFDDRYAIWAHARQMEGNPKAMTVMIDGKNVGGWRPAVPMGKWGWDSIGSKRSGDPQLFTLRKGPHTLALSGREGQRIATIVMSSDPRWPHNGFDTLRR